MLRNLFAFFISIALPIISISQETFPVNGVHDKDVVYTAFTNATLQIDHQTRIENATLLTFKGKIVAYGNELTIPDNCVEYDMTGKIIYPSFIELDTDYGMPKVPESKWEPKPQYESNKKGVFGWNQAIKPEVRAAEIFTFDKAKAKEYLSQGFGAALSHQKDGIARGTSTLVNFSSNEHECILITEASAHYSFRKGSSRQNYPSSLMGSIALLRQTYYDAKWYESNETKEKNLSLEAWNRSQILPQIFETGNKLDVLRADAIGDEFDIQYVFKGSGDEYQRMAEIIETKGTFILPLNFPAAYDVSDPYLTRLVSLREMKHWEFAPMNPAIFEEMNVPFVLSSSGHKDMKTFLANLRKAVEYGLSKEAAIYALTEAPALLINAENRIGKLGPGMDANFFISSKDIFEKDAVIYENWVLGERNVIVDAGIVNLNGSYNLNLNKEIYTFTVSGKTGKHKGSIEIISKNEESNEMDTTHVAVKIAQEDKLLTLNFEFLAGENKGLWRLSGNVNMNSRIWDGKGQEPNGNWIDWVAVRQNADSGNEKSTKTDSLAVPDLGNLLYPLVAYGWDELPKQETIWIKNATIWTCEEEGKLEKAEMLIHNGKIAAVGKLLNIGLIFPKEKLEPIIIDAKGKHITPGIIDEHTHIAISRGVNEGTQASSAEVSIADVVNSDDVNIYRQLAGGVTAAQLLHGSANPIGGQSGIIKFRWGLSPEKMKVENATPFIKFALGENVKQSNWGDYQTIRFPQTRMGVEQVFYDHFIRAREYGEEWKEYNDKLLKLTKKQKRNGDFPNSPRRDIELQTLLQILNSERFVTCHSYRQDEINMLMHVADSMGFRLNTFTHILEGYKVADKMKAHGAGGSSFSDWWAYKYEVKDAIPYNGALLWEQGIVTAFNSDDREMARRLNQEAAKAVKYGNVPEEEALKFVTLNPAKLLHLDDRMGSLKVGKDADFVIWTDNPLSIYAKAEKTYIDGTCYYSMERDLELRVYIQKERARLIQKMLGAKEKGEKTQAPKAKEDRHYHCDTLIEE